LTLIQRCDIGYHWCCKEVSITVGNQSDIGYHWCCNLFPTVMLTSLQHQWYRRSCHILTIIFNIISLSNSFLYSSFIRYMISLKRNFRKRILKIKLLLLLFLDSGRYNFGSKIDPKPPLLNQWRSGKKTRFKEEKRGEDSLWFRKNMFNFKLQKLKR
jgi:hypothetical protein